MIRRPRGAFDSGAFKVHPFLFQELKFNNQSQGVKEKETRQANHPLETGHVVFRRRL